MKDLRATDRHATCFDVNPANADPYEFAHQMPCPLGVEPALTLDTDPLTDGPHQVRVVVEDAGGDETVVVDRRVVVDNHPEPALRAGSTPGLTGALVAGEPLTGLAGSWEQQGRLALDTFWERCPSTAACTPVGDGRGETYVPDHHDVGHGLRFAVLARNAAGETTTAYSPISRPIARQDTTAAPGQPSPALPGPPAAPPADRTTPSPDTRRPLTAAEAKRGPNGRGATTRARLTLTLPRGHTRLRTTFTARPRLTGRLVDQTGRPIAGATLDVAVRHTEPGADPTALDPITTADDGTFTVTAPGGPSRSIQVGYRADLDDTRPATSAAVELTVPASLTLKVKAARPGRPTWLTGRLTHLPRPGVELQVQALDGRRWRTFDTTRTGKDGHFRYGHRFKPTAAGRTFALRVVAADPTYPFARNASPPRAIRVPR